MSGGGLTTEQKDRAAGVLLGLAIGDALGVPYEFRDSPLPAGEAPQMLGGGLGPYAPGEYSDDTQMAVCIANVAVTGVDLRSPETLDAIADGFLHWMIGGATDVGNLTRGVLGRAAHRAGSPGERCRAAAQEAYERSDSSAGNGALMRTAPVALFALGADRGSDTRTATAEAARLIADLTHADPLAGDSCVLWCEAIRVAVLEGRFELAGGLDLLPESRHEHHRGRTHPRDWWARAIDEASGGDPRRFHKNGSTFGALKAAWAAITATADDAGEAHGAVREVAGGAAGTHARRALETAVRIGHDTDTVAAIAGGLVGARYGAPALPADWRLAVNGWSGVDSPQRYRAADLARLGLLTALGGTAVPGDEQIWQQLDEERA